MFPLSFFFFLGEKIDPMRADLEEDKTGRIYLDDRFVKQIGYKSSIFNHDLGWYEGWIHY